MKINCFYCGIHLGEIRDATLRKNIKHLCGACADLNKPSARVEMPDFFKDLMGGKYGRV